MKNYKSSSFRLILFTFFVFSIVFVIFLRVFSSLNTTNAIASPTVSLSVPGDIFVGENFSITSSFNNAGTTPGYGPFIDLVIPYNGVDGVYPYDPGFEEDGVDFISASYSGVSISPVIQSFPDEGSNYGCIEHAYAVDNLNNPIQVCGTAGDKHVSLQLPFGSFVTDQPVADVNISLSLSNLADVSTPLDILATGGFTFGQDPLKNPSVDPSIYETYDSLQLLPSTWTSATLNPTIFTFDKSVTGPDVTGPNFPGTYTISADVADGQVVSNFQITDNLEPSIVYLGNLSVSSGCSIISEPVLNSTHLSPDNEINVNCGSITGGVNDPSISFDYYVADIDANSSEVINHQNGNDSSTTNVANGQGDWIPIDSRDLPSQIVSGSDQSTKVHESISIDKSFSFVSNTGDSGISPGDVVAHTLNFQISDYFAYNDIVLTDIMSDGQRIDNSFVPTLIINSHSLSSSPSTGNFDISNYSIVDHYTGAASPQLPIDGSTELVFRVSDELLTRGESNNLLGGCVPVGGLGASTLNCIDFNGGATTATIVYRAIVQDEFSDDFPSGDSSVDQGDVISNSVEIDAEVLDNSDLTQTGFDEQDSSSTSQTVNVGTFEKTIYAVNGNTSVGINPEVSPGDEITYRLDARLPTSDVESLSLVDYLPLPVFESTDPAQTGSSTWSFDSTKPTDIGYNNSPPASGVIKLGPDDDFHLLTENILGSALVPTINVSGPQNSFELVYGEFDDPSSQTSEIDILFTVTVSSRPFANNLLLTNQASFYQDNTNGDPLTAESIAQIRLFQPDVHITKGFVNSDNPISQFVDENENVVNTAPITFQNPSALATCPRFTGTINSDYLDSSPNPLDSNIIDADAGDRVTAVIVLENQGNSPNGAFDNFVQDSLPSELTFVPGSICVQDGTGASLTYSQAGTGLFGSTSGDYLEIDDPGATNPDPGGLDSYDQLNGRNIAVITYDVIVDSSIEALTQVNNTASLINYSGSEGGEDYTADDLSDNAFLTSQTNEISKSIVDTNQTFTSGNNIAIGEIVTYEIELDIIEGTSSNVLATDTLDSGLAYVQCNSITTSNISITADGNTDLSSICSGALVISSGRDIQFDFGEIVNADTDNLTDETITINYDAVVLDIPSNSSGTNLNNSVDLEWGPIVGDPIDTINVSANDVSVFEPDMSISKNMSPINADAGDIISVTLTITNQNTAQSTNAFDIDLTDILPSQIEYDSNLLCSDNSGTLQTCTSTISDIDASWEELAPGQTETVTFDAILNSTVYPDQTLENTADITYSTLLGDPGQISVHNTDSTERNYTINDNDQIEVFTLDPTKTIVGTSESHTSFESGRERVSIGEVVRYRMEVRFAESTGSEFILRDNLPNRLQYIDDNTAMVAFVANGTGISSTTLDPITIGCQTGSGQEIEQIGNESTLSSITPICPLPDSAVSSNQSINQDTYNSGTDIYFKLGDIVNDDRDVDYEYIVVEFNVLALNHAGNISGTNRGNTFDVIIDSSVESTSNNERINIVEPEITTSKIITNIPSDADDSIVYEITISNSDTTVNGADAFDINLLDTIDSSLSLNLVNILSKPLYTNHTDNTIGSTVDIDFDRLDKGDQIVVEIVADVTASVNAGEEIENIAVSTWTSLPGVNGTTSNATGSQTSGGSGTSTGERNGTDGEGGALNIYESTGSVSITIDDPEIDKLAPVDTTYSIGELVTYDILVTLPEGTTQNLEVQDQIPDGMDYENYSLITTAAASGGLMSNDFNGTLSVSSVTGGLVDGEDVSFQFGNITSNPDAAENNESFVLRIESRVKNNINNQNSDSLDNTASLTYTEPNGSSTVTINDPTPATISIVEPILDITKSVVSTPSSVDGAGQIEYQVSVAHNALSTVDAFDVSIQDLIPPDLENIIVSSVNVTGFGVPTTEFNSGILYIPNQADQTFDFPLGATLTINYTADIISTVEAGKNIENDVNIVWSSIDGVSSDERGFGTGDYDYSESGISGLNDYRNEDDASVSVDLPQVDKLSPSPTEYTIGEKVSYDLVITIPEGVTNSLEVTDNLPIGLNYQNFLIITSGSPLSNPYGGSIPTASVSGGNIDGDDVVFSLGNTTNTPDGNPSNDSFVIRVEALVSNIGSNQNGTTLSNTAELSYENPNDLTNDVIVDPTPEVISLVEPVLNIQKTATSFPVSVMAGSIISYEIVVSHDLASTADAYDVIITDPANSALTNIHNVSISTNSIPVPSFEIISDSLRIPNTSDGSFDLPQGETITITFDAQVANSVGASEIVTNNADVTWTSTDGSNSEERNGSGGVNDYLAQDNDDSVSTESPAIDKYLADTSATHTSDTSDPVEVTIGETVTFLLRANLPEGTTDTFIFEDSLPNNLDYIGYNLVTLEADSYGNFGQDFNGSVGSVAVDDAFGDGNDLEFTLSNIVNNIDGNGANNFLAIEVITRVLDDPINFGITPPGQSTFNNSLTGRVGLAGATINGNQIDLIVVEPEITITKDFDVTQAAAYEIVNVTSVVENTGTSTAFDIDWEDNLDLLDAGVFDYNISSLTVNCSAGVLSIPIADESSDPILNVNISDLPPGESCEVSYSVTITDSSVGGTNISNRASVINSSSLPGNITGERIQAQVDADDSILVLSPDLQITKTSSNSVVSTTETIIYNLSVSNIGTIKSSGIEVMEVVPEHTTFDPTNSTTGWVCLPDGSELSTCTFDLSAYIGGLGELAPLDPSVDIDFAVITDDSFDAGVTQISNSVSVEDDGTHGNDMDASNNTDNENDNIDGVTPDLAVSKDDGGVEVYTNDFVTYTINYSNQGLIGASGVELTETVPVGTQYVPAENSDSWICAPDNSEGSVCTLSVGNLEPSESGIAEFTIQVLAYFPDISQVENTISISDDGANGIDSNIANNSDTDETPLLYTNVFDPPSALKTFNASGLPEIEWKMVWINDGNAVAINTFIFDPISPDISYVEGSVLCDARGTSTTDRCEYNEIDNQIEWEGDIAPDIGGTDEDDSVNEVVITFRTSVPDSVNEIYNQAFAFWDGDGNGSFTDDITNGQQEVPSNDPSTIPGADATVWVRDSLSETGINSSVRILFTMIIMIAVFGLTYLSYSNKFSTEEIRKKLYKFLLRDRVIRFTLVR